ncbi:hypothetical protein GCM10010442_81840 [Kitasatospora kifunensis]
MDLQPAQSIDLVCMNRVPDPLGRASLPPALRAKGLRAKDLRAKDFRAKDLPAKDSGARPPGQSARTGDHPVPECGAPRSLFLHHIAPSRVKA